jgi:hypothetical protein
MSAAPAHPPAPPTLAFTDAAAIASVKTAMDPWRDTLEINSCIEQVRLLYDVLPRFGLTVTPLQVDLVCTFNDAGAAFVVGSKTFQRSLAKRKPKEIIKSKNLTGGFLGHMVAVVNDRYLLDPSIRQVRIPVLNLDAGIDFHAAASPDRPIGDRFHIEQRFDTPNGTDCTFHWISRGRKDYLKAQAWTQPEPPEIIEAIVDRARRILEEGLARREDHT